MEVVQNLSPSLRDVENLAWERAQVRGTKSDLEYSTENAKQYFHEQIWGTQLHRAFQLQFIRAKVLSTSCVPHPEEGSIYLKSGDMNL